jgi:hypothetical protein
MTIFCHRLSARPLDNIPVRAKPSARTKPQLASDKLRPQCRLVPPRQKPQLECRFQ